MKNKQRGDAEIAIVLVIAIALVGLMFWSFTAQLQNKELFNRWTSDCNQLGGQISQTREDVNGVRYECFVKNVKVVVPGYESYQ